MASRFQLVPATGSTRPEPNRWPADWLDSLPDGLGWTFAHHSNDGQLLSTGWRLVGANNRELGRSPQTFPNVGACRDAVTQLLLHLNDAQSHLAINNDTGLWTWRLNIGDQWIAVAGRSYQRRRECLYNVTRFLEAAPNAELAGDLLGRSRPREAEATPSRRPSLRQARIDLTYLSTNAVTT